MCWSAQAAQHGPRVLARRPPRYGPLRDLTWAKLQVRSLVSRIRTQPLSGDCLINKIPARDDMASAAAVRTSRCNFRGLTHPWEVHVLHSISHNAFNLVPPALAVEQVTADQSNHAVTFFGLCLADRACIFIVNVMHHCLVGIAGAPHGAICVRKEVGSLWMKQMHRIQFWSVNQRVSIAWRPSVPSIQRRSLCHRSFEGTAEEVGGHSSRSCNSSVAVSLLFFLPE